MQLVLCLSPAGQVRLRQHNHRTTKSESFWEDAGHADIVTGLGALSLRSFGDKGLPPFLLHLAIAIRQLIRIALELLIRLL